MSVVLGYLFLTFLFNISLIKEILHNHQFYSYGSDTILTQYFGEWFYQRLIAFHNPFTYSNDILYPFGAPTVFAEGGFIDSIFFIFLRPLFSPHTSLLLILIISLLFAALLMYKLLRELKVDKFFSFLFGAVYAFSPFVSVRIQYHFNYVYHYLFVLTSLLIILILKSETRKKLLMYSLLLGISGALLLFNTFYYVIIYSLFIFIFAFFYVLINSDEAYVYFRKFLSKIVYFGLSIIVFLAVISPFSSQMYYAYMIRDHRTQPHGRFPGGTIEFSANALDIVKPSEFNPFFGSIVKRLDPMRQPVEQVIYPGVLVLAGLFLFFLMKRKKKSLPLFLTGLSFYILSLGPFLHVGRFWKITIAGGIIGVLPLPYIIVHSLPLLSSMRSPVRYGFMIAFAWSILAALVFNKLMVGKKNKYVLIPVLFLAVFLIDQSYITKIKPQSLNLPLKSYDYIKKDPQTGAVMELPFDLQDGFLYWGEVFYGNPMIGQLIHKKPIIGGYIARISPFKLNYYMSNPLLSYFGILVDDQRRTNTTIVKPSIEQLRANADFLDIRYILVRRNLPDYTSIRDDLRKLGYKPIYENDNNFALLIKNIKLSDTRKIDIGQDKAQQNLFGDWSKPELSHQWVDGDHAGILFNSTRKKNKNLRFEVASYKIPRVVTIYVNGNFNSRIKVDVEYQLNKIQLSNLQDGINKVEFIVEKARVPRRSLTEDPRNLSVSFKELSFD